MKVKYHYPPIESYVQEIVREGLITKEQLAVAMVSKKNRGEGLGSILIQKRFLTEPELLKFLSRRLNVPFIDLQTHDRDLNLLREISASIAKRHLVLPLRIANGKLEVAMADPTDVAALDDLKMAFGNALTPSLASAESIEEALEEAYAATSSGEDDPNTPAVEMEPTQDTETSPTTESKKIQEIASGPNVIAAVNQLISQAWDHGASDIHIEPSRDGSRVRTRIDGILQESPGFQKNMYFAIISRIKIMAGLDIAEHRIPQDGRVRMRMVGRVLDLRVSTCPTQYGEKVVLRLLSKEVLRTIEDLGMEEKDRKCFTEMITKSHGIFLTCGPTGSGKSTTLYAALTRINTPDINIISIEDPIESEITGVSQIAINPKANLTFPTILRSVLRQDPDVIMVGEIRDTETANIAVRAAITGHLVLSTLHTNTAAGAISRLMDLGVEPFLLSTALQGVLAQRLARKICPKCKEELSLHSARFGPYAKLVKHAFRGRGCSHCRRTGYRGRIGIFELAPMNDTIRELIYRKASDLEIEKEIRRLQPLSIREEGLKKVEEGITTIEEVLRVTEE